MFSVRPITITSRRFRSLVRQLRRRGAHHRESGAFLLASSTAKGVPAVIRVAYYDDLDADCLTGGISMSSSGFARLNGLCVRYGVCVVADVHTHPSAFVAQSWIDSANPMVAFPGHLAFIVPDYASGWPALERWGAHLYFGSGIWTSMYGSTVRDVLQIMPSAIERLLARLIHTFRKRKELAV